MFRQEDLQEHFLCHRRNGITDLYFAVPDHRDSHHLRGKRESGPFNIREDASLSYFLDSDLYSTEPHLLVVFDLPECTEHCQSDEAE